MLFPGNTKRNVTTNSKPPPTITDKIEGVEKRGGVLAISQKPIANPTVRQDVSEERGVLNKPVVSPKDSKQLVVSNLAAKVDKQAM